MNFVIGPEPPDAPGLAPLFAGSDAFSAQWYPPESNHTVPAGDLAGAQVTFLVARCGAYAVGCGAVIWHGSAYGELKRMFVADAARGMGVARALLAALEAAALKRGVMLLRLETGIHSHAALRLYRSAGFAERGPFDAYRPDPLSVFMEKRLS